MLMFVRNEDFRSFLHFYPVVSGIVVIHLILFLWMFLFGSFGGDLIFLYGVGDNLAVAHGEWWRLVTPIFMHVLPGHVLFNSFSLVLFGPALERILGKSRFIAVYVLVGILANVATYYIGGLGYSRHLGASGAIFGLFGVYLYMSFYRKDLIDRNNAQVVKTILIIGLIMTFINARINVYAHVFGFLAGVTLAPIFLAKLRRFTREYQHVFESGEISFNPNRWQKKRLISTSKKKLFWIIFGAIVLIGMLFK